MFLSLEIFRRGKLPMFVVFFIYLFYLKLKNKNLKSFINQLPKNYTIFAISGLYFSVLGVYKIVSIFSIHEKFKKEIKLSTKAAFTFFSQKIKISEINLENILKPNSWSWDILEFPLILGFLKTMTRRRITKLQRNAVINLIIHRLIKRTFLDKLNYLIKSNLINLGIESFVFYLLFFYSIIRYLKLKCLHYFIREKRIFHLLLAMEISIFSIELSSSLIEFLILYLYEKHFRKNWVYIDETSFGSKIISSFLFSNRFRILNGNFSRKKKMLFALFLIQKLSRCHNLLGKFFLDFRNFTNSRDNICNTLREPTEEDIKKQVEKICVVCREKQETPEFSKKLECKHIVHTKCIQTWLICQKGCPACSYPIVFYDGDFEEFFKKTSSDELNFENPFLNIICVFLGLGKKINTNKILQKKKNINRFSLPCLFPKTTDLLLFNFTNCKKTELEDKQESFKLLFKKTHKKSPNGLQIFPKFSKEYFQIRWTEEKIFSLSDSILNEKKKFFKNQK
ncbi:hypothetical protein CMESO_94 (nucleomorph) [Chroomonas mesostigmatica CCMP1168]|uniref:RING-type domain-containing protein n=1 Tax=Chroomonas mesostigmatica CCMP1168 TaxID=1195612 RepID=J7G7M5_9CRYP|nr:hypothetical protein CMESO_94 [Chroomonas mesostigmatica CCMP1168]